MSAPWLNSYPEGVPAEIDLGEYNSIIEILEQSCSRNKDLAAFVNFETRLTYAELDLQTRNFAAWLQKKGLEKGDRIIRLFKKHPETLVPFAQGLFRLLVLTDVVQDHEPFLVSMLHDSTQ